MNDKERDLILEFPNGEGSRGKGHSVVYFLKHHQITHMHKEKHIIENKPL